MRSSASQPNKYLDDLRKLVLSKIEVIACDVFLFGSYAEGTATRGSDVDIGFWGDQPIDQKTLREIRLAIENSRIPYRVDLVDFGDVEERFKQVALRKIIVWNKSKNSHLNSKH